MNGGEKKSHEIYLYHDSWLQKRREIKHRIKINCAHCIHNLSLSNRQRLKIELNTEKKYSRYFTL